MADRFSLAGRVALISGAGRGIGRAIALAYADAGANLVLCSRTAREVEALAREVEGRSVKAVALRLDVSSLAECRAVAAEAIERMGRIDILVNNAGTAVRSPAVDVTEEDWDRVLDTNLRGLFFLTQAIGQHMIARGGGRIINLSSVGSLIGTPTRAAYAASKAGVNALTRVLAVEWGPHGIAVNAIAPSFVRTPLTEPLFADPATLAGPLQRTPLGRFPEAEDIAAAAVFLASEAGRSLSGQVITVDGGRTVAS